MSEKIRLIFSASTLPKKIPESQNLAKLNNSKIFLGFSLRFTQETLSEKNLTAIDFFSGTLREERERTAQTSQ